MKYFILPVLILVGSLLCTDASAQSAMSNGGNRFAPGSNDTPSIERHRFTNTPSVALFPQITFGELTIQINFDQPESFDVNILDVNNVPVMTWHENAVMFYNRFVDVSTLPPGNYTVVLTDSNFTKSAEFTKAK